MIFFLTKFQFIFYACFLSSRPSLTRNTIFLATQLPNKNFDIFLPLILRLWLSRVCDFFFKKNFSLFFRVSCRAGRVWQETPFFLQHSYRIKISIFLRLILRLWRVWYFFKKNSVYFLRVFLVEQAEFDKKHHFSCNTDTE